MENLSYTICSLIFLLIIIIVYFTKQRINNVDNKIFSGIILVNIIGAILEILNYILINHITTYDTFLYLISTKFILIYYLTWDALFFSYILAISNKEKYIKKSYTILLINSIICLFLPIEFDLKNNMCLPNGASVEFVYGIAILYITIGIIIMLKNLQKNKLIKYLPFFALIVFGTISMFVQMFQPELLMMTFVYTICI